MGANESKMVITAAAASITITGPAAIIAAASIGIGVEVGVAATLYVIGKLLDSYVLW